MNKYKVILSKYLCPYTGTEFYMSFFKDDLSLNYGEKHFITELAEIAIINFFEEATPSVFDEIDKVVEEAWNNVQVNKHSTMLPTIKQRAWRFFTDLSPKGCVWFSEGMVQNELCMQNTSDSKLLSETALNVEPINLSYNKWSSLSDTLRIRFAEWLVLNSVDGMRVIVDSPYHNEMKKEFGK